MRSSSFFLSALVLAAPAALSAQQRDTAGLDPIVVTTTRLPVPLSYSTQAVTVLRGDDLRARGVTTVALALREVPGATVVQSGSYGGVTSLFLRGGESRYTKVLVDGVSVNMVGGTFFFENLTTDNIDRIEVVRGPVSAIYGADAVSGVVQIFTRRGVPGATTLDASARTGTFGSRDGDVNLRGGNGFATYSLGGGLHRTDGILPFNNNYYNGVLSGSFSLRPDSATLVALTSRYTGASFHYPTDYTGTPNDTNSYTTQHRLTLGVDAARMVHPWLTLHLIGANNDVHDLSSDLTSVSGTPVAYTRTTSPAVGYRRSGEFRADIQYGLLGTLSLGGQYEKEFQRTTNRSLSWTGTTIAAGSLTESVTENSRTTRGYYAAMEGTPLSRLTYDASVRYDDHSDFKNITTYHGGVRVSLLEGMSLRASYGTAFNAPAFYATQGSIYNTANASLQPEQTHTLDGALEQLLWNGRVRASIGAFDQHFSQVIQYVSAIYDTNFVVVTPAYYDNLTQVRAKGYEGELHALLFDGLTADVSYTQTISKVFSVAPTYGGSQRPGDALLRRPSHSGSANVGYARTGLGSIAATASYVGKRPDQDFSQYPSPTVTLPSYVKLDLSASADVLHGVGSSVALTARLENALDKKYQDVFNFQTPGRAFFIGARVTAVR